MPNQRKPDQIVTSFTIPKHLLAWVKQEAEKRGQSTSEYIRNLILNKWDKFNEKQEKKGESSKENQSSRILPD
jgi:Arc/MetJ-type ribon-helix-helix transcriptional regulator